jgi:D-alanyl-lipoteichoic acid acyltransferase DltB (MBOAT superfamily)
MVFSSTIFLFIFLPLCLLGYYLLHLKLRNIFLLIMSLGFYAWGEPHFVFLMVASIVVNWFFGLAVHSLREKRGAARVALCLTVAFNIGFLFVFKYLNFTIANLDRFFGAGIPQTSIVLPIGISFFTFQALSYVIDVYRQDEPVQKNPLNVALYIAMFPQLIAGPIVRYGTIASQLIERRFDIDEFSEGIRRFIRGLAKKVLIANNVALVADAAFGTLDATGAAGTDVASPSQLLAWLGLICYTLQIFFDFSGYSDMAIGLGKMFGFRFPENFNYPYVARSITDFWRRWHMSLSTWFRDYVYFPLGGSRVDSKVRLVFNLFVVWTLTGIWHGANWTFVFWGLFYFALLCVEKLLGIPAKLKETKLWALPLLYRLFTLVAVMFAWVFFRADNMGAAVDYLGCLAGLQANLGANAFAETLYLFHQSITITVIGIVFSTPVAPWLKEKIKALVTQSRKCQIWEYVLSTARYVTYAVLLLVSISAIVGSTYNPFIYFNF